MVSATALLGVRSANQVPTSRPPAKSCTSTSVVKGPEKLLSLITSPARHAGPSIGPITASASTNAPAAAMAVDQRARAHWKSSTTPRAPTIAMAGTRMIAYGSSLVGQNWKNAPKTASHDNSSLSARVRRMHERITPYAITAVATGVMKIQKTTGKYQAGWFGGRNS